MRQVSGGRVSNAWATCLRLGDNTGKLVLIPHNTYEMHVLYVKHLGAYHLASERSFMLFTCFLSIFYSSKEFRSLYTLDYFPSNVVVLLFNFQWALPPLALSFGAALADSLHIISHQYTFVNTFFQLFFNFFEFFSQNLISAIFLHYYMSANAFLMFFVKSVA